MKRWWWLLALLPAAAQAADVYAPGSERDLRLRTAKYLAADDRFFSAIVELRAIDPKGDPTRLPTEYQRVLAESYLSFGMRDRAEALFRHIAVTATNHAELARARLRLAELEYQRGYLPEARATLMRMREKLPQAMVEPWQDLLARVLLAEGRYGQAAEVLTDLNNARKQTPYTRYNLGVALVHDGRVAQGRTVLDRIGRMSPKTLDELALRDRANLSLGWNFLQNHQAGTARPVFSRVRVEGPFSNRALLGLGWAELAPEGGKVERVEVGDEAPDAGPFTTFSTLGVLMRPGFLDNDAFKRFGLRNFRLRKARPDEEEALRKALVPWVELISRDPMDPAVQEAWLAIPFSLDKLGAHIQALQFYERAVDVLLTARKRHDEAIASIRRGRMVETIVRRELDSEAGWEWKLKDLPDAPETYFLQTLLAEHRFQEALKNYRDVRLLARNLDGWKKRLDEIERGYAAEDRAPAVVEDLFAEAKTDWVDPSAGTPVRLRAEDALSAPGTYGERLPALPVRGLPLTLAPPPARFAGPIETAQALKARIAGLREQVAIVGGEQGRLLQDIAIKELDGQRQQVDRYLVEARFALARLYDRQQKGELDAPAGDEDEDEDDDED